MGRDRAAAVVMLAVAGMPGCGGNPAPAGQAAAQVGNYTFRIEFPKRAPFEGRMVVTADTVMFFPSGTPCVPASHPFDPNYLHVRCGDIGITVDRKAPIRAGVTAVLVPAGRYTRGRVWLTKVQDGGPPPDGPTPEGRP